jgi:hypothetical protein
LNRTARAPFIGGNDGMIIFLIRYALGCLLLWISSGCISLALIVAPTP